MNKNENRFLEHTADDWLQLGRDRKRKKSRQRQTEAKNTQGKSCFIIIIFSFSFSFCAQPESTNAHNGIESARASRSRTWLVHAPCCFFLSRFPHHPLSLAQFFSYQDAKKVFSLFFFSILDSYIASNNGLSFFLGFFFFLSFFANCSSITRESISNTMTRGNPLNTYE